MKKFIKSTLFALIAMLVIGLPIGLKTNLFAFADTPVINAAYSVKGVPTSVIYGDTVEIQIPVPDGISCTLFEPDGKTAVTPVLSTDTVKAAENIYTFTANKVGEYRLRYIKNDVMSPEFLIKVVRENGYTFSYTQNSSIILPVQVGDSDKKIEIPLPNIFLDEDQIMVDGAFEDYLESGYRLKIEVYAGDIIKYSTETVTENDTNKTLTKTNGNYAFVAGEGKNDIKISLLNAEGNLVYSLPTRTVIRDNSYTYNDIKISFTVSNLPKSTSASLKEKVYLPYATAKDDNHPAIAVSYKTVVKVLFGTTEKTVLQDENGLYFIPTEEGDYQLVYNVVDFYGNKSSDYTYGVKHPYTGKDEDATDRLYITDRTKPALYILDNYVASKDVLSTDAFVDGIVSTTYDIPNKIDLKAISLPALFAKDIVDGVVNYSKITRQISVKIDGTTKIFNLNNAEYHFYESETDALIDGTYEAKIRITVIGEGADKGNVFFVDDASSYADTGKYDVKDGFLIKEAYRNMYNVTTFDFTKTGVGTYTLTYQARDAAGNYSTFTRTIEVISGTIADKPVIKIGETFPSSTKAGAVIEFTPVITDNNDSDLKLEAYILNESNAVIKILTFENGKIKFTVDSAWAVGTTNKVIKLQIKATNDFGIIGELNTTIAYIDSSDPTAPTVDHSNLASKTAAFNNNYKQGDLIKIGGVIFTDANYLKVLFEIRDANDNIVTGASLIGNTIADGIQFYGNIVTSYTISYIGIDAANNITIISIKTPILADTQAPVINKSTKSYTMELGTELDLGTITVTDNLDANIVPTLSTSGNASIFGNVFIPYEIGTFTILINAKDAGENEASPITVTVKVQDVSKPTIIINNGDPNYDSDIKLMPDVNNKYKAIYLPDFITYDKNEIGISIPQLGISSSKITVTGPDSKTYTIDATDSAYKLYYYDVVSVDLPEGVNTPYTSGYYFTPNAKGTYSIVYSATDKNKNDAVPVTITVTAGDTVKPTITLSNEKELSFSVKVGETFVLDTTKVVVYDAVDGSLTWSTIKIYDSSSNVISPTMDEEDKVYTYTLSSAGEYKLEIIATDKAGNKQVYSKTITVFEETTESIDKSEIIGIVLIVVSVVVLAGVIIFFVKTKKKS